MPWISEVRSVTPISIIMNIAMVSIFWQQNIVVYMLIGVATTEILINISAIQPFIFIA